MNAAFDMVGISAIIGENKRKQNMPTFTHSIIPACPSLSTFISDKLLFCARKSSIEVFPSSRRFFCSCCCCSLSTTTGTEPSSPSGCSGKRSSRKASRLMCSSSCGGVKSPFSILFVSLLYRARGRCIFKSFSGVFFFFSLSLSLFRVLQKLYVVISYM